MRLASLRALLLACFLVVVLTAAACGGDEEAAAPEESATDEGSAEAADAPSFDLRIGALLPLTGDLSSHGPSLDASAKLAGEQINATLEELGLSDQISLEIITEDDQTEATASVEAATKLVQSDDVHAIVGGMSSAAFIPTAQSVTIPNGIVHIGPTISAFEVTDLDDDGLVYRIISANIALSRGLAEAVGEAFGTDASVAVGGRNDAWGAGLQQEFERLWKEQGGTVSTTLAWNPETTTLNTEAQRLAGGNPDGWVIFEWPDNFAKLGPALVQAGGWTPDRTFMTEAMAVPEELKQIGAQATEGLRGVRPSSASPVSEDFRALFEETAPDLPFTGFEATSFDGVMLAFLAAVKAGSSDPGEFKNELQAVSGPPGDKFTYLELGEVIQALLAGEDIDYEGAWGSIDWDEAGDPGSDTFDIFQVADGDIEVLETFTSESITGE